MRLDGERLQGLWTLVPAKLGGDPKNWLLIRKAGAKPSSRRYAPMLATLAEEIPKEKGWLYEVKWDGYRTLAYLRGGEVKLLSRRDNDLTERFATVARALPAAIRTPDCVLDGEVCAIDENGRASFSAMQQGGSQLVYYVFDVLELDGEPLIRLPLSERHERLAAILDPKSTVVRLSETFDDGPALVRAVKEQRLEGVMAKKARSPYEPGRRSRAWLKVKATERQEFVIAGYTKGRGRRSSSLGALVLAVRQGDGLRWVGNCGTGFGEEELARLLRKLRPLERKTSPFHPVPKMPRVRTDEVVWVTPKLVCEAEFAEWTHDGHLRAPRYVGLRDDKAPAAVRREHPVATERRRGKRVLKLSNLDKVFWPAEGITKGDLIAYYEAIAPARRPAPQEPAVHDEALSRRDRGQALLPKGRAVAHARVDPDRDVRFHIARVTPEADAFLPARERRARAPLDGEHGLHRPELLVLAGRQARPARLLPLRPRPVRRRRLPRGRAGRAPHQAAPRRARPRRLPEDERRRRDARARPGHAAAHLRRHPLLRGDRRRRARRVRTRGS